MLSAHIIIVFVASTLAVVLFIAGWVHYNLVAVSVLLALWISSVVPMDQAIKGFANPTAELGQQHGEGVRAVDSYDS